MADRNAELIAVLNVARARMYDIYDPESGMLKDASDDVVLNAAAMALASLDNALRLASTTPGAQKQLKSIALDHLPRMANRRTGVIQEEGYVVRGLENASGYFIGERLCVDQYEFLVADPDWSVIVEG